MYFNSYVMVLPIGILATQRRENLPFYLRPIYSVLTNSCVNAEYDNFSVVDNDARFLLW